MIFYEYSSNPEKRRERLLTAFLFSLAILLLVCSYLPGFPLPWILQVLVIGCLSGGVYFAARYLLRTFFYRLEESATGGVDLIIVEKCRKRLQTVCRISTSDVSSAERITETTKKQLLAKTKGSRMYRYQAQIDPTDHYLLTFLENGETAYLLISADQRLIDGILSR